MKILHVLPPFGHISIKESYIRFINENFDSEMHYYTIIGASNNNLGNITRIDNKNIKFFDSYRKNLLEITSLFLKFDKVIYHELSIPTKVKIFFLLNPLIMKKIVWIAWGSDLYQWKKVNSNFKNRVRNIIEYTFRKKIKFFVGIFPPDIYHFKKNFKSKAQTFYASYVVGLYNPLYKKKLNLITLNEKRIKKDCINIQVGHKCMSILNHMEVLENLAKFKDENIKIYIPLSYRNKEYGDKVEEKAKILFGYKAISIREMMDMEDYMDFLSTIDIAIFNTSRQIGLGNINPLLYMEKKVFMPAGSVMYDYFNSLGINICDYAQIQKIDFGSFIESIDMTKAKQHVAYEATNKNKKIKMWSKVFNA